MRRRPLRRCLLPLTGAASFLLLSACAASLPGTAEPPAAPRVKVVAARIREVPRELEAFATLEPVEKIAVSSRVEGRLAKATRKVGERVAAGELLAEIEKSTLELEERRVRAETIQAEAALRLQEARLEEAGVRFDLGGWALQKAEGVLASRRLALEERRRVLRNQETLLKEGGATLDRVESLRCDFAQAEIDVAQAARDFEAARRGRRVEDLTAAGRPVPEDDEGRRIALRRLSTRMEEAEVRAARAAWEGAKLRLESVELMLRECEIRAPRSGLVAHRGFEPGEEVPRGQPVYVLFDPACLHLSASIGEREFGRIRKGNPARIHADALGTEAVYGTVSILHPVFETASRTGEVKILVANPAGLLRPGMGAEVAIRLDETRKGAALPANAVVGRDPAAVVWVVEEGGVARLRKVSVEEERETELLVTRGLKDGDLVVVEGLDEMREGKVVEIRAFEAEEKKR